MSLSIKFKNAERSTLSILNKYLGFIGRGIVKTFRSIAKASKTRFTIMLIPHSEKKVVNFKISAFTLAFFAGFIVCLVASLFTVVILWTNGFQDSRTYRQQLSMAEQHKRNYYQAIEEFNQPYRSFETTLNHILKGHLPAGMSEGIEKEGDFQDINLIEETKRGQTPLISTLKDATNDLELYTKALVERADQESKITSLLQEIPAKWPIRDNQGYISANFGPAPHPIKRVWYLHKGVDIAFRRGTPIIATANGKVVEQKFNKTYGNYIILRHEYGFYTKYAHMDNTFVKEGDIVTQGQAIGALGNTGLSSGPHVHYEIRINSQVIDPIKYIKLLRQ